MYILYYILYWDMITMDWGLVQRNSDGPWYVYNYMQNKSASHLAAYHTRRNPLGISLDSFIDTFGTSLSLLPLVLPSVT
jgi:hypothetical protein